jgi:hypothetical protein
MWSKQVPGQCRAVDDFGLTWRGWTSGRGVFVAVVAGFPDWTQYPLQAANWDSSWTGNRAAMSHLRHRLKLKEIPGGPPQHQNPNDMDV